MNIFIIVYIIITIIIIAFLCFIIQRQKKVLNFAAESLKKFAIAMSSDNPAAEVERVTNDIKNFK